MDSVAAGAEQLTASVREISEAMLKSKETASGAVDRVEAADQQAQRLSEAAGSMSSIVELIGDITGQINLLALNATIESARAGDAGRGFAVVAQEVKTLAGQTAKATSEIAEQIAAIQGSTKSAVAAVREIGTSMRGINEVTSAIAGAVEEQGVATREISQNAQMAAQVNETLAANISSVNHAIVATKDSSGSVLSASEQLGAEADRLARAVTQFFDDLRAREAQGAA
jgi:methyl-accepting chemotaxis protein